MARYTDFWVVLTCALPTINLFFKINRLNNEDLRQARVFWSLPYAVLMMSESKLNRAGRAKLEDRMQKILIEKGSVLQVRVYKTCL